MSICLLASVLSVMGWFLILSFFVIIFAPLVYGFYEESCLGIFSFIVIPVVYGLCFWGLYTLVMQSETMAPVREVVGHRLLAVLVLHAAFPICLVVLGGLFGAFEIKGTEKNNTPDHPSKMTFQEDNNSSEKKRGCLKTFIRECNDVLQDQKSQ